MYHKAILATAVGFVLSIFGPIDEWSHFESAFTSIAYGFFTCPTLQIDDSLSQKTGKDDGIRLVRRNMELASIKFELASTKFELVLMKDEMAELRQMVRSFVSGQLLSSFSSSLNAQDHSSETRDR